MRQRKAPRAMGGLRGEGYAGPVLGNGPFFKALRRNAPVVHQAVAVSGLVVRRQDEL